MVAIVFVYCAATPITSQAQTLTTLYSFCSQPNCTDGAVPGGQMVQATDGNFYGTTQEGGGENCQGDGCGTVFKITPSGTLTTLHSFAGYSTDGSDPNGLMQANDGNFYGTTGGGGANNDGTVFRITPIGTLTILHSFNATDGELPQAIPTQGNDGNFYGTAVAGGLHNGNCPGSECGTVFKITPSGTETTLYNFCSQSQCADGDEPYAALVQATDGNFYGTTKLGGGDSNTCGFGCGTVFRITPTGALTTLYRFCAQPNCADGEEPLGGLVQGNDGNLYGTTSQGGTGGFGTVFKITLNGTLTKLYNFTGYPTDGAFPVSPLVQATDGNFYGSTEGGGANNNCEGGCGTAFKITPSGMETTLYSFCSQPNCADGYFPNVGPVQAADGKFYGTTLFGGANNSSICNSGHGCGTFFSLSGPGPSAVQFVPVTPCRLVDTRQTHDPVQGGTWQDFIVPQLGGCGIPATAAAYSLNVTVVPEGTLGYLTIWPASRPQPYVSTMNSPDGRVKANAAIVPAGASGAVSVYATDTTDVILDINGYFALPGSETYAFYTLPPCRIVDTRNGQDGGTLQAGVERDYSIRNNCGVPNYAAAYSLNVTVIPAPGGLDYMTVWPAGEPRPTVSTLNDNTGTVVANAAIVPAGSDNLAAFYPNDNNTDLLVDVDGYFATPGTNGLSLYPTAPCRVLDTRQNNGPPFVGEIEVNVVGSVCAPPSSSEAYVFNATVVPSGVMPFLTLWPDGSEQPFVSTLNAYDGFITSNMAIVPTTNGFIDAYAAGLTQLILDISGYFAP